MSLLLSRGTSLRSPMIRLPFLRMISIPLEDLLAVCLLYPILLFSADSKVHQNPQLHLYPQKDHHLHLDSKAIPLPSPSLKASLPPHPHPPSSNSGVIPLPLRRLSGEHHQLLPLDLRVQLRRMHLIRLLNPLLLVK
jgi:hypothetical protein